METEQKAETKPLLEIYRSMVAVASELTKLGVAKGRRNEQQNYAFRGIDEVMNAAGPILAKHEIVLRPFFTDYPDVERVTAKGSTLIYSKVRGDFTFISAKDGSYVTVTTFGVAMDAADKSVNKAMSAALKYCLLQCFLIPTESSEDADATTPEPSVPKPPDGFEDWFTAMRGEADHGFEAVRQAWKDSPEHLRTYAMEFRGAEWAAAKAHANKVTADLKKAAAPEAAEKPAKATK